MSGERNDPNGDAESSLRGSCTRAKRRGHQQSQLVSHLLGEFPRPGVLAQFLHLATCSRTTSCESAQMPERVARNLPVGRRRGNPVRQKESYPAGWVRVMRSGMGWDAREAFDRGCSTTSPNTSLPDLECAMRRRRGSWGGGVQMTAGGGVSFEPLPLATSWPDCFCLFGGSACEG